jgi:MoaA/NifB/PqqE/SkfB family radical SAM enzyme
VEDEQVFVKLFGKKLVSYKQLGDGSYVGTGLFNPLVDRLSLFAMIYVQSKFYKRYQNLATWHGKRVPNSFAPPVGSRPQFRALRNLVKTHLFGRTTPCALTFAVTYRCQCNCVHCSAAYHLKHGDIELSTDEAKKLIDDSQDLGITILAFTGGEPLLREDIFDLISYVNQKKTLPIMFTNGLLLGDDTVKRLVDAGLYSIFVSLDSPVPSEHDRMRGMDGLFEKAVGGMMKMKEQGVMVGISSYASRTGTAKGMYRKLYSMAQELGVHNLLLFDNVPTGRRLKDTSEVLTMEQREEILNFSEQIFSSETIPPLSSQSWQNSLGAYLGGIGCLAANIQYYVSAYGEVTPCDFAPLSFGNIREEPLKKIWRKMVSHPAYCHRTNVCRMQDPKFRKYYVDPIPDNAILPYSIDKLPRVDYKTDGQIFAEKVSSGSDRH